MRLKLILEECVGCGNCTSYCPLNLAEVVRGKVRVRDGCTLCGACVTACGYYAIKLEEEPTGKKDEMSYGNRI